MKNWPHCWIPKAYVWSGLMVNLLTTSTLQWTGWFADDCSMHGVLTVRILPFLLSLLSNRRAGTRTQSRLCFGDEYYHTQ